MGGALANLCRAGLLSFLLISCITVTSSMTFDLTELRNKVAKIKVNPRGNLWATGHFMGKKSVDSSFMEPPFGDANVPTVLRAVVPLDRVKDLQQVLIQELQKQALEKGGDPA